MSRRRFSVFLSISLIATLQISLVSAADIPDEQFFFSKAPTPTSIGVVFSDTTFFGSQSRLVTNVQTRDANGVLNEFDQRLCSSPHDNLCQSGNYINYLSHLPNCESARDIDCVESLFAIKPDGSKIAGIFLHGLPEKVQNPFEGDTKLGIPRPGSDSLWRLPGIINGGGSDTYLVISTLYGNANKTPNAALTVPVPLLMFTTSIFPVSIVTGNFVPRSFATPVDSVGIHHLQEGPSTSGNGSCIVASTTECSPVQAFPPNIVFGLSLRVSQNISGWLHGRMSAPKVEYKRELSGTNLVFQGLPVKVPVVLGWSEPGQLPPNLPGMANPIPGSLQGTVPWGNTSINLLKIWLPVVKDTAQANPSEWIIRMLRSDEMQDAHSCMQNSNTLAGIVTTNSTVYSAGPPTFDPASETLDYTLISPHFTSKREIFRGYYDLIIRSDVARCIYKFTNAPIKATISVTDDSGQASVAVESMSERDGWIYLSASGFTFSSPTVRVKLIGTPIPVAPIATPSPTPTSTPIATPTPEVSSSPATPVTLEKAVNTIKPVASKKRTINCYKGKTIRKITAVKPSCPKGYEKKKV